MSEEALDVVGIGSMVVDRLHRVTRILGAEEKGLLQPMAGGAASEVKVGGVMLNQMGWAAALGLRSGLFGKQADDEGGRFLRAAMDRHGIARHIVLDGSASANADIYVDDRGGRAIYMAPGATAETTPDHIRAHHTAFIGRAARVVTEVSQLPLAAALEVARVAAEIGTPLVVDLDLPPSDAIPVLGDAETLDALLRAATLLKPAKAAAAELVPEAGSDAASVAEAIRARFGNEVVAVTDGEAGCAIATADGVHVVPGVQPREVVDTTGAGDAFMGGLLFAMARGFSWPAAGALANASGAACVERLGAFPDEAATLRARIAELYGGPGLEPAAASEPAASGRDDSAGAHALGALDVALAELAALRERLDAGSFEAALALIRACQGGGGRVHVTGIGKPEHVARYGASLFASTGTPASFLHGTEAVHGSAGQVQAGDLVVAISNSGETAELRACVEAVRGLGARVLGVTGDGHSWLAKASDVVLDAGVAREGGGLGLAPRASVAAELLVLAALSAALEDEAGFTRADYHARHPAGALGARSRG